MRALYASENKTAVKMADGSDDIIEGIGMPWGGTFNGQDIEGEHFSPKTEFAFDWFTERPLLYQHGLDGGTKLSVVGRVKEWASKADLGVWVKAQLDQQNEYFSAIKDLIDKGKLFFSSGAMRHLVEVNRKTGEIKTWPWVELSLTPTPANLLAEIDVPDAQKHFDIAGIKADLDELRAAWTARYVNDLPDSSFAFIEGGGEKDEDGKTKPRSLRHFPYRDADGSLDEAHVRNALGRIPQSTLPQEAKDKALGVIRRAAKELGIEIAEKAMSTEAMRKMVRATAKNMDMELSDEQMAEVMDGLDGDADLGDVMKEVASRLKKLKAAKAMKMASWEDVRNQVQNKLHQMIGMNPFAAPCDCWIKETYSDHCLAEMHQGAECRYYHVGFELDADGNVTTVGPIQEMEETYIPKQPETPEMPLGMMADMSKSYIVRLMERTKDLHERRVKEGRVISTANRQKLQDCLDAMAGAATVIKGLLTASEPQAKADLGWLRRQAEYMELYARTF